MSRRGERAARISFEVAAPKLASARGRREQSCAAVGLCRALDIWREGLTAYGVLIASLRVTGLGFGRSAARLEPGRALQA